MLPGAVINDRLELLTLEVKQKAPNSASISYQEMLDLEGNPCWYKLWNGEGAEEKKKKKKT